MLTLGNLRAYFFRHTRGTRIALYRRRVRRAGGHRTAPVEKFPTPGGNPMKRGCSVLVLAAVAFVMALAPLARAADLPGQIKAVDASRAMVPPDAGNQD